MCGLYTRLSICNKSNKMRFKKDFSIFQRFALNYMRNRYVKTVLERKKKIFASFTIFPSTYKSLRKIQKNLTVLLVTNWLVRVWDASTLSAFLSHQYIRKAVQKRQSSTIRHHIVYYVCLQYKFKIYQVHYKIAPLYLYRSIFIGYSVGHHR